MLRNELVMIVYNVQVVVDVLAMKNKKQTKQSRRELQETKFKISSKSKI